MKGRWHRGCNTPLIMRFAVFGLTLSSSWGNGHATLWRGLCRALARRGHSITFFERDTPYYATHRDLTHLPGTELVLYPDWDSVRARAIEAIDACDVGIVTSYCADAIRATRALLDAPGERLRVFYDLDAPVTLERLRAGQPVEYLGPEKLRGFDLVLSYAGGTILGEIAAVLEARRVAPLYGSVDPEVHRPAPGEDGFRGDLSYLGTYAADRQEALERLFLLPARRTSHRFVLGGSGYPAGIDWPSNVTLVRHVPPGAHSAFFGSSPLTLNVTRAPMVRSGDCPSGRLFEAAACGCVLVTDPWEGLERFFEPGREILVARDTGDVIEALALPRSKLRSIARAARARALEEHSSDRRASDLLQLVEA